MASTKALKKGGWHKRNRTGLYYVSIWLIGFALFQLYPFLTSLYYSFTDYSIFNSPKFIGFSNYVRLFTIDPDFMNSMKVTLQYTFITVPGKVILALLIALLLNKKLKGVNYVRTIYYIPSLLSGSVAVSILWKVLFAWSFRIRVRNSRKYGSLSGDMRSG